MIEDFKLLLPQIEHCHYVSDGPPSPNKNCKNLTNFMHHEQEHQISAEWLFCSN